jgi:hypothetical protein
LERARYRQILDCRQRLTIFRERDAAD